MMPHEILEGAVLGVRRRPADPLAWRMLHDAAADCGLPWPGGWLPWRDAAYSMGLYLKLSRRTRRKVVNRLRMDLEKFLADALEKMGVPTPIFF